MSLSVEVTGGAAVGAVQAAAAIGRDVAGPNAAEVDQLARFPRETVEALKRAHLMGALVPVEYGGQGLDVRDGAQMVRQLARHCASSALVLAMHNIQVACLVRHAATAGLRDYLRQIVVGQLLLANANSEVGIGGDARSSGCAVERTADGFNLSKHALAISYGAFADGILATARRDSESPASDQVLVVCAKPQYTLEASGSWDTVGLRGTCSSSFRLNATGDLDYVMPDWATISSRTGLPVGNLMLSSVWLGIAESAATQAHAVVRKQALKHPGQAPPSGLRLAELATVLQQLRDTLEAGINAYEAAKDSDEVESMAFSARAANIKVSASTLCVDIVRRATLICGIDGYRQDSPTSVARQLRDAQGAPLMVNNDRVLLANAQRLLAMHRI
jgi:acyl-CoA dehydrogenase